MSNIGYATLGVIPSLQGAQAALTGQMAGPSAAAGAEAGGLFGGRFSGALGGILAGGAAVTAIGAGLAAIGGSFDEAFDAIRVKTGATGAELEGLKDVFKNVVSDVPTDFATAADAIGGLQQRLHLTGGDLEALSERVLELSRITDTDLTGNVDAVTRAFGDWGITTDDMGERLDQLFRASQLSGTSVSDLATNVTNFGSPLRQLGFGLTDSLALFSRFAAEGVNTSTVMSGMRMAVKNLGSGFAEEETGVQNFGAIVRGVKEGWFDLSDAMTVFGARAGTDVFKAIEEGRFDLESFSDTISNGRDTILGAAADTNDWRESLELLKNRALVLIEPIATRVFNALGDGAKFATRLTRVFDRRGLTGVLTVLKNKFDELSPAIKAVGLAVAFIVAPWLTLGAVIGAGIVYAYTHFETFRNVVDSVVSWLVGTAWPWIQEFAANVKEAFSDAVAWVQERWPAIQEAVGHVITVVMGILRGAWSFITAIWRAIGDDVINIVQTAWNFVSGIVRSAMEVIRGVIDIVLGIINGDWQRVWNGIKSFVSGIWHAILALVRAVWNNLKSFLGGGLSALRALWSAAWNGIKAVLRAAWEAIKNAVRTGVTAVVNFFREVPGRAISALSRLPGMLLNAGRAAMRGLRDGLGEVWDRAREWITHIPQAIITAIGDVGELLLQKGRDIIQGLIDGMQSVDVGGALTGIIDSLPGPNLSNPLEALEIPASRRPVRVPVTPIMDGSAEFSFARNGAVSRRVVSSEPLTLLVGLDVTGGDEEFKKMVRKWVRVEGGNVQAVLGA